MCSIFACSDAGSKMFVHVLVKLVSVGLYAFPAITTFAHFVSYVMDMLFFFNVESTFVALQITELLSQRTLYVTLIGILTIHNLYLNVLFISMLICSVTNSEPNIEVYTVACCFLYQ